MSRGSEAHHYGETPPIEFDKIIGSSSLGFFGTIEMIWTYLLVIYEAFLKIPAMIFWIIPIILVICFLKVIHTNWRNRKIRFYQNN